MERINRAVEFDLSDHRRPPQASLSLPTASSMAAAIPVIYGLGSNGSGQLGVGHTEDVRRPENCLFKLRSISHATSTSPESRQGTRNERDEVVEVKKIVAGGNHTLVLARGGMVFAAGRFGSGLEERVRPMFEEIDFSTLNLDLEYGRGKPSVTDIAATWEASFFVFDDRVVFACGAGAKGQLGLGKEVTSTLKVKKVFEVPSGMPNDGRIVDIAASMAHVVILLSDGTVFGWGNCRKGQLGDGLKGERILWLPRMLDTGLLTFQPEKVLVGREYTAFIRRGKQSLLLGETKFFKTEDLDEVIRDRENFVSGWSSIHSIQYTASEKSRVPQVKSVGRNDRGQLAPNNLPKIRALAAGSEHCVAITHPREVVAWGWGEHGNCGEDTDDKGNVVDRWNTIPMPELGDGIVVKVVAAGCATSFVICGKEKG